MGYHSSTTYNFTAFTEADLLAAGSGNGDNLGYGDTFTMPGSASVEFSVTDNDSRLSGDSRRNENSNDTYGQQATITQDGREVGNGGQIYAEGYMWLCDQDGNWYLMIEIEQEGGGDDYFAFHEGYGIPPAGAELTVSSGSNINCWEPKFDDLTGGKVESGPEAVNDMITITEDQSIGDASDDARLNILANDSDATLATVNDAAPGALLRVKTVGGVDVQVTVDADGNLTFDTDNMFEDLKDGESDSFSITYTATGPDGFEATASATVQINGVSEADAGNDLFIVDADEGAGDTDGNILTNDKNDFGALKVVSLTIDGETKTVGEWLDLDDGGRVRVDALGNLDFDADGDFDGALLGDVAEVSFDYSIGREMSDGQTDYACLSFNGLSRGTIVTDQFADRGLTISSANSDNPVMIFDTARPTGHDYDLRTRNLKKVLILSEDGHSSDPDDNAGGGTFIFDFEREAKVKKLTFLDTEKASTLRFYDADGTLITTLTGPSTRDGGQARKWLGVEGVSRMEVDMVRSGALDNLIYEFAPATSTVIDDTATAKIVVNGLLNPNLDPTAVDNGFAVQEDADAFIVGNVITDAGGDIDAMDSDPDGDDADLTVKSVTVNGQTIEAGQKFTMLTNVLMQEVRITIASNGDVTFDGQGKFGALADGQMDFVSFNYTVQDLDGGEDSANVVVTVVGEDETPLQAEYNILFLVDASAGLASGDEHDLFLFTDPVDLKGDGAENTVLDAELSTVQQFVDQLGALSGFSTDVEIGVQTFASNTDPASADDPNKVLADANGNTIFTSGDDLTEVFQGAGVIPEGQPNAGTPAVGVAAWNTAIAGANEFFEFTSDPAGKGKAVNLVYILSDSEGVDQVFVDPATGQPFSSNDRSLADELADLQSEHNAVVDSIIYNDSNADSPFLTSILAATGGNGIELVENQIDLSAHLTNPLLENLGII